MLQHCTFVQMVVVSGVFNIFFIYSTFPQLSWSAFIMEGRQKARWHSGKLKTFPMMHREAVMEELAFNVSLKAHVIH